MKKKHRNIFEQYEKSTGTKISQRDKEEVLALVESIIQKNGKRKLRTDGKKGINESKKFKASKKKELISEGVDINSKQPEVKDNSLLETFEKFQTNIETKRKRDFVNEGDLNKEQIEIIELKKKLILSEGLADLTLDERKSVSDIMEAFKNVNDLTEYNTILVETARDIIQHNSARKTSIQINKGQVNESSSLNNDKDPLTLFKRL